jgi:hypothetical protein
LKEKIYSPNVENGYLSLLPSSDEVGLIQRAFNTGSMLDGWRSLDFIFDNIGNKKAKKPDVRMLGGGFAFRRDLKDLIFPTPTDDVEFLPILASGEPWLVANCLTTTLGYDPKNSVLYRDFDGTVYMIVHLILTDRALLNRTFFVIEDSNRTILLSGQRFFERVMKLGVGGIRFREIGTVLDAVV